MEDGPAGAQLLPPAEADWPPELRLPAPPPPPPAMDDSQFLGSIMGESASQGPAEQQGALVTAPLVVPKKRGRPPKKGDGSPLVAPPAKPAKRRENEEEVVCFICFDGGNLVVCDRRGCPKVYHPPCIKRDESFFNSRSKWNCGWHICSSCEKAVHYMCYTCTYSLCKMCIKQGKFFAVRGAKGFCDTCFGTILLIESKDEAATKLQVDFDDINSWEYLFKLYWLDLKGKLSLTLEELTSAKSRWTVPNTCSRKEKDESSDDLYDINNEDDTGFDCSSRKRRQTNSSRKKGRKRQKVNLDCSIAPKKVKPAIRDDGSLARKVPTNGVSLPVDTKWASPELLEFVGHMKDGDQSFMSQFDVQTLLLEYIKKNNLRDPQRKSQIICDARLHCLFRKTRVAHFEMLKLLEMHFPVSKTSTVTYNSQVAIDLNSAQIDTNGYSDMTAKPSPDKRRKIHRKMEREPQVNPEAYAAVDMHNINLIYMRRSLMEELIDDAAFLEKINGAFVRIKIFGVGQKQDMYRLVKVVGTHKVPEKYSIGKKTTNFALEILNLDKKEIITMDTISNQGFTEEECNRLRQSMKCGLISWLKVGAVQEKAMILQSVRVNDWLENEKQRLGHLRDRASETGCKKQLRECVEKLQLLNDSEERTRRINEVLEVHVDPHMDPNYESAEEMNDKKFVGTNVNQTRADTSVSQRKSKYLKSAQNPIQKIADANHHPKNLSMESTMQGLRTGRKFENFHHTNGTDVPTPSPMCEAGSVSSSVLTMSSETEPEKVWHYKDPLGNVQGPFTLLQLSKWTSYFPRDLRVWLTFESEERSLLLTEVLSKQQTVFNQTTSVSTSTKATSSGMEGNKNTPSVDQISALSPTGYSMVNSSVTVQSNKYSVPERESVNSPEDCLSLSTSSVQPKDVHTLNSPVQCHTKHSVFVQSPGSLYGLTDVHRDGAHGGCSGESNHRHSSAVPRSSIMVQMNYNGKTNVVSHHHNQHTSLLQNQNDSKNSSQGVCVKDLSKNLPTRVGKDAPSPLFAWSPSESRTASSQHEGSCLSSTTNPSFLDEHHSSIASVKSRSCVPTTPVEDRGSSSPSGMLSHSERVPIGIPRSTPSASASDMCKIEENMSQQRTVEADVSNASVNQSPESKMFLVSSPDNQDIDRGFPSPTPRPENKEPVADNSGLIPASPEKLGNTCSPISDPCKMEETVNQDKILEPDASNNSANYYPQSEVFHVSSSNNKDLEQESQCPIARSDNKEPAVDSSLLTSAATESLRMVSASDTDTCKMKATVNQQETLEEDASNASLNQSPHCNFFPIPSDNQDIDSANLSPTPKSGNKEFSMDNSRLKSADPEILSTATASASNACKMEEILDKEKTVETDASDGPITLPSKVSLVSSPSARSDSKEPPVDSSLITSAATESLRMVSASDTDTCKMKVTVNQQETLEEDASNASLNQSPHSNAFPISFDNQDIDSANLSPTPRSGNKELSMDNSRLKSADPENLSTATASVSNACKMEEILDKKKTVETDASDGPITLPSNVSLVSSPTARSDSKEPPVDSSLLTSAGTESLRTASASDTDTCKMEAAVNQQKAQEEDASDASLNWPPHSSTSPISSTDNQDTEHANPSPTPRSRNKYSSVDNSGLESTAPENLSTATAGASTSSACKMEILDKKIIVRTDASDGSITLPSKVSLLSSPDNLDTEHEFPCPAKSKNMEPLVDNSVLTSATPENVTTSASASDRCKMGMLDKKTALETDTSNGSVIPSSSEDFLVTFDNQDSQREYPSSTPRTENKELVVDTSRLQLTAPQNLTTKVPVDSPDAFALPKSSPSTGKRDAMESDFKGIEQMIQNELYIESTVVTRENVVIDPSCGAESIDVSDVLESLLEQRCETSYINETAALEDFLAATADEPQCSSPIALSPWGEPSYYQGDAVDSALWGVQDDPVNDMWSLLSPTPVLQPSSAGLVTEASETLDIKGVVLSHGINGFFQRGPQLGEENVNQAISGAATDWVPPEQVKSKPNYESASSVAESTGIVGWQPPASQSLPAGTASATSLNLYVPGKSSWEASKKQEPTDSSVSSSREAAGNTNKSWNPPSVNASRGNQKNHRRGRYSEISESWLLSSNNSRSRSDRFGNGGSSRSSLNGQARGLCKFHEGGHCRKGASCSYLHS